MSIKIESKVIVKPLKGVEPSFTVNEIEKMAGGAILERDGVCYCLSNGVMMYCKDLDQDIWHAFNGIEIN